MPHVFWPGENNYGRDVPLLSEHQKIYCVRFVENIVRDELAQLLELTSVWWDQLQQQVDKIALHYITTIVGSKQDVPKEKRDYFVSLLLSSIQKNISHKDVSSAEILQLIHDRLSAYYEKYKTDKDLWIKWSKCKNNEFLHLLNKFA